MNPIPIGSSRPTSKLNIWTTDIVIKNNGIKKYIYRKNGVQVNIFGQQYKINKKKPKQKKYCPIKKISLLSKNH